MCMCLIQGGVGGEWMRGLGFTNPVGTRGVLDVCLCCGDVGGVGGEWVGAWARVWSGGWCYVCVSYESGFTVLMAGTCICILCLAATCASYVHTVYNPVILYEYLLHTVYLFMADIANPDLYVCGCRTWICRDITRFYECAWSACPNNGRSRPRSWWREVAIQFAPQQFVTAVTAPPLVGCVEPTNPLINLIRC